MTPIGASLAGVSRRLRTVLAVAMVGAIGAVEAWPESRLSLVPLYALPVAFAGWYLSRAAAISIAALAAALPLLSLLIPRTAPPQPLLDGAIRLAAFSALAAAAAALRGAFDHARSDELTGIPGERAFSYTAAAELQRARRYGRPLTVAYIDIDGFKELNERIGRAAGDAVLRSAARSLRRMLRASDVVARVGDDEFALLLPEASFSGAQGAIEKIRTHLPRALERGSHAPRFSIGAATFPVAPDTVDAMLGPALRQLERAKRKGPGSLEHEVVGRTRAGSQKQ